MDEIKNRDNYAKIEALEERRREYKLGGGQEKIEKLMHSRGKLSIRERIDLLFDEETFVEQYLFAKSQCRDLGMDKMSTPSPDTVRLTGGWLTFMGMILLLWEGVWDGPAT